MQQQIRQQLEDHQQERNKRQSRRNLSHQIEEQVVQTEQYCPQEDTFRGSVAFIDRSRSKVRVRCQTDLDTPLDQ